MAARETSREDGTSVASGSGSDLRPGEEKLPEAQAGTDHPRDASGNRGGPRSHLAGIRLLWTVEHRFHRAGTPPLGGGQFGHLTQWLDNTEDSPYACFSRKLSLLPISTSEDDDGPSRVRVPARGLPVSFSGSALAS